MTTIIRIDPDRTVKARHATCWNMSLLGPPKMTVFCGHCSGEFSTRRYYPMRSWGRVLMACCRHCGYWNATGLYRD